MTASPGLTGSTSQGLGGRVNHERGKKPMGEVAALPLSRLDYLKETGQRGTYNPRRVDPLMVRPRFRGHGTHNGRRGSTVHPCRNARPAGQVGGTDGREK